MEDEFIIGFIVGVVIALTIFIIVIGVTGVDIPEDLADEVCQKLYGNNTEFKDGIPGRNTEFICVSKTIIIEQSDERIRLEKVRLEK